MGKPFGSAVALPKLNFGIAPPAGFLHLFSKGDRLYTRAPGFSTDKAVDGVISEKASSDAPETYPFGTTMFGVGNLFSVAAGWPADTEASMVVTFRASKDPMTGNDFEFVTQRCFSRTTNETWFRTAISGTTWGAWQKMMTGDVQPLQPYSKRYRSNNTTISNNANTSLLFGSSVTERDFDYNVTADSWTVKKAGLYLIVASVEWERNSTNRREVRLRVNGGQVAVQGQPASSLNSDNNSQVLTYMNELAVDDTVRVDVWQNSGGNLSVMGSQERTFAALTRVSA